MPPRLLLTFVLLSFGRTFSEQIGDFAPLAIGNLWVYDYSMFTYEDHDEEYDVIGTKYESHIQMQITGAALSDDTTFYFFRNSINGTTTIDKSTSYESIPPRHSSVTSADIQFDTLYEVDGIITPRQSWRIGPVPGHDPIPVCSQHSFDTADLAGNDLYFYEEGCVRILRINGHIHSSYEPDKGLTGLSSTIFDPIGSVSVRLESFTRAAPISIQTSRPPSIHRSPAGKPSAVMALPNPGILRNGRLFDLKGRINQKNHSRKSRAITIHQTR